MGNKVNIEREEKYYNNSKKGQRVLMCKEFSKH